MTKHVQISRSSVSGARPTVGSQPAGSLYLNFADQKLGYIDPDGAPIDLPTGGDAPVTSVNGKIGDVVLTAADVGAVDATHTHDFPVDSVNGKTGDVVLTAADVGAADAAHTHDFPVDSVNGKTGDVVLTAADVGAADAAHLHDDRYSLLGHNHDGVYAPAVHGHAEYVAKTGDTMSGTLEIGNNDPFLRLHNHGVVMWDLKALADGACGMFNGGTWAWYSSATSLYVPGNIIAYWSDARLKEAVRDLDGSEDRIMALRPVSFSWNKKGRELTQRKYREREIGFIAQEVQAVSDQYVAENLVADSGDDQPYLTVKKDEMIADLVALVQSLTQRVRALEDKANGTD